MKNVLFITFLFISSFGFSQEKDKVEGNTVTTSETAPIWPGCEAEENKDTCFNDKLVQHIIDNYIYPKDAEGNYIKGKSVVSFRINKEGKVEILSVEGEKPALNEEAKRIIAAIPEMEPGKRAGKTISLKYKVPFTF